MAEIGEQANASRVVVIALDGSDFSNNAFEWFRINVHKAGDYVIALHCPEYHHILHTGHERPDIKRVVDKMEEEQQRKNTLLEGFSNLLSTAGMNGKVKSIVGHPGETIVRVAEEENAAMIVSGSRGVGKLRRTLLGSVSDYVIHHSHVPVVVCRQ